MRKAELIAVLVRRLNVRHGRLVSLTQRASEFGLLRTNAGRRPDFDLDSVELGRMLITAAVDEGLSAAGRVISKYGGALWCAETNSTLESMLGFTLTRPERVPPSHSSLTIFTGDAPSAILKVATPDGVREFAFVGIGNALPSGVERTVKVGGAALFAIANEIAGRSPEDVDKLLEGATIMKPTASAVN